jgi:SAM-dependent methyltransferase
MVKMVLRKEDMLELDWHEDDRFWAQTAPFLLSRRRWEAAPEEVEKIVSLLGLAPGAAVLDLCCGPGRHAFELARRGFRVTGVDRTMAFLAEAQQRAQAEGLDLELVQEDMRRFLRPQGFDAAINMFTSFGFFAAPEDDLLVLRNVSASLRPGGRFLIEMNGKEVLARIFRPRDWTEHDGALILEERELLEGWSRIRSRWIIVRDGKREEFTLTLCLYSGAELPAALQGADFRTMELFGSLDGVPYDQNARRLVALATK